MRQLSISLAAAASLMTGFAASAAGAPVCAADNTAVAVKPDYSITNRPPKSERLFHSKEVEKQIARVKAMLTNKKLAWMFENCFPNTIDTTVHFRKGADGKNDTFVYTGDIHAMWLRDSGAQVWPYVQFANEDKELKDMLEGVIRRQLKCIIIDPYANAFNDGPTGGNWMSDLTDMKPELHERKWEIDSLCYPLRLAYEYWTLQSSMRNGWKLWRRYMPLSLSSRGKRGKGHTVSSVRPSGLSILSTMTVGVLR